MLKTVLLTTLAALFLSLLLPAILGALAATVFSGLSILDPLYAGERSSGAWGAYGVSIAVLGLHVIITTPLVSAVIYWFADAFRSRWFFLVAAVLSSLGHFSLSNVYLEIALGLSSSEGFVNAHVVLGAVQPVELIAGPSIGILAALLARRNHNESS